MSTSTIQRFFPKWNANITIRNFPAGQDAKVQAAAIRYFLYYKHGQDVRNGLRDFDWAAPKAPRQRGPVQMKTTTLEKKLAERYKADPTLEWRNAAYRLANRKGVEYRVAKAEIMELYGISEDEWPTPVEAQVEEEEMVEQEDVEQE